MSEPTRPVEVASAELPAVDHPAVAEALEQIGDLDARPLEEHHERLSRAHQVLHEVLNPAAR